MFSEKEVGHCKFLVRKLLLDVIDLWLATHNIETSLNVGDYYVERLTKFNS